MKTFKQYITESDEVIDHDEKFNKEQWLSNRRYKINADGTIDIIGDAALEMYSTLTKLPFNFGRVTGNFLCQNNNLATLEGAPKIVGGDFICATNKLTSLEGAPKIVGGDFICHNNKLITLEGSPEKVHGDFICFNNQLTTLKGSPKWVGKMFDCYSNFLTSLQYAPVYIGGTFDCEANKIANLNYLPEHIGNRILISGAHRNFTEEEIQQAIEQHRHKKTLSHDDEMPDVGDIFD
tara:strand:- start:224 stop:931 length:708 start_codon:yes stop_codon:yes gene_type:complete